MRSQKAHTALFLVLGTFEDLKKPYPTEFGLPYVVLASTTASSNWRIYQEKHRKFKANVSFKSFFCFYFLLRQNNNKQDLV